VIANLSPSAYANAHAVAFAAVIFVMYIILFPTSIVQTLLVAVVAGGILWPLMWIKRKRDLRTR
jgi:hypothetical protein